MAVRALELIPAGVVALKCELAYAARDVLYEDRFNGVSNAHLDRVAHEHVGRNQARAERPDRSHEDALQDVSGGPVRIASSPRLDWLSEASTLPPVGIQAGQVQCGFIAANAF